MHCKLEVMQMLLVHGSKDRCMDVKCAGHIMHLKTMNVNMNINYNKMVLT